jgi:hypothetical protein
MDIPLHCLAEAANRAYRTGAGRGDDPFNIELPGALSRRRLSFGLFR